MTQPRTFLVLGATGGTGKHFTTIALSHGHRVRALVRSPDKLPSSLLTEPRFELVRGSITDPSVDTESLVSGVDYVISMLGDKHAQSTEMINTSFMKRLVPSMRKQGCNRILYQAGGMSRPYEGSLGVVLWLMRNTLARVAGYEGQHRDNEGVMEYFATARECEGLEWMVHLAGIGGDGPTKGRLERTQGYPSIASHLDCAEYSYRLVRDDGAVRTSSFSRYV